MKPTLENDPDAIRSDIDETRRHMDQTIDQLGDRLKGRHLVDEVLGFFRSDNQSGAELRAKITDRVQSGSRRVVETVKANPLPVFLIGAGVAWMVFSQSKRRTEKEDEDLYASWRNDTSDDYSGTGFSGSAASEAEALQDRPLHYLSSSTREAAQDAEGNLAAAADTSAEAVDNFPVGGTGLSEQLKQGAARAGESVRDTAQRVGERSREIGAKVQQTVSASYQRSRDRVATTVDQHPLGVGLAVLAIGVAVGLALPTPEKVKRAAAPSLARLRNRVRTTGSELVEKGRRVADAAASAAKNEVQAQGLPGAEPAEPLSPAPAQPAQEDVTTSDGARGPSA